MTDPDPTPAPLAYTQAPALPESPPTTEYQRDRLRHQLAFLLSNGQQWRTVITDSENLDGIAPRCTSPDHPEDDKLQQGVVYDCCDFRPIETGSVKLASFFVGATRAVPALLVERDALAAQVAGLEAEVKRLRLQNDELSSENHVLRYGPTVSAENQNGDDGDVPCLWCHCDGCDECTGEGGVVCGCQDTSQR